MTNKNLLKEAIADAKAVKETAIANAKLALEEAFTPHLKSMLSAKLQEMDEDEEVKEEVELDEMDAPSFARKNSPAGDSLKNVAPTKVGKSTVQEDEVDEEINLDELEITEPYNNLVKITLKEEKDFIILTIQNNGKPFPKNFNKEKFIRKFSTGKSVLNENQSAKGSGLGGYDINRIALRLKSPDWNLDLKNDSNFKVSFKFIFKKIY